MSVLTNAIDGPAGSLAEAALKLIDLAASKERGDAGGLTRFTGRFANLWGVADIVVLGGRLYAIDPTDPDPAAEPTTLEPDGDDLRVTDGSGYGSYGEAYRYTFAPDGTVESVRGSSGLLSRPIDTFTLPTASHGAVSTVRV